MKKESLLSRWLIWVVVSGLMVINVLDVADVLKGKGNYPFGSEFFGVGSIYGSKEIYIFYRALFILLLSATLIVLLKKGRRRLYILLTIDGFIFLYPILTVS